MLINMPIPTAPSPQDIIPSVNDLSLDSEEAGFPDGIFFVSEK